MNNFPPARAVANHVTTCLSMCLIILFFTVGAAAAGGEFIWEYEAEYSTIMTPAVSDGNVYMPVSIKFMCLDSLTGSAPCGSMISRHSPQHHLRFQGAGFFLEA